MGRSGRSRKRKDAMNRVKRERNAKKELARLKVFSVISMWQQRWKHFFHQKTLGLVDADGNDLKMELNEIAEVKTAAQLKKVLLWLTCCSILRNEDYKTFTALASYKSWIVKFSRFRWFG